MFDTLRDIWIVNGILAGGFTVLIQLYGIMSVIVKLFVKKL